MEQLYRLVDHPADRPDKLRLDAPLLQRRTRNRPQNHQLTPEPCRPRLNLV